MSTRETIDTGLLHIRKMTAAQQRAIGARFIYRRLLQRISAPNERAQCAMACIRLQTYYGK